MNRIVSVDQDFNTLIPIFPCTISRGMNYKPTHISGSFSNESTNRWRRWQC